MARFTSLLVMMLVLAGCGGAGQRTKRPAPRPRAAANSSSRHLLGWLVRTAGPPPSIAAENAYTGTSRWRLPGPREDVGGLRYGHITGYVAEQALLPGQVERIYVSAPGARFVRIGVFRIGWYHGMGGREVLASPRLRAVSQPPCLHRASTGLTECAWHPTFSFRIPAALPSGVYIAQLSTGSSASDCLFVVRASASQPLLAQLPTSTYEAYNAWGGDSLYVGGADLVKLTGTTQGVEVSYERPYDSVTGAGQFFARDVAMVQFLERFGYPVSYTASESVDQDPGQLAAHRGLIDFGHSEYWSERQFAAFARARDHGTSLLFFGSDTLGWRVRYAPASRTGGGASAPDHTIIAYKEHSALAPDRADRTGGFLDGGAQLSGSAYLGCITPRVPRPGPPTYLHYRWAPAPGLQPRWLFHRTGITAATTIPGIVGYELDMRALGSPPRTLVLGSGRAPCMAGGQDQAGQPGPVSGHDLAETTLYTAGSGAIVFNTGTLGWELALEPVPSASPDAPRGPDPRVVGMTRNLLDYVLRLRSRRRAGGAP